ncbi:MAG: sugar porter family MFS transporter [Opitutaceae bacterium]|nr:sugar porter family MFS transporter [Opitutaceae bacterium]
MSPLLYVIFICAIAAFGGLLFGYDTAVISGATEAIQTRFALSDLSLGWVVSSALVGCVAGTLIAGWFADRFGRKLGLIVSGALFAACAVACAFAPTPEILTLARFIGGVGVGMASMVTPIYIAEVAPARIRGGLVTMNQIAIVSGMVLSYLANRMIVESGSPEWMVSTGWRWMLGMMLVPCLIFLVLTLWVPESPRWLAKRDRLSTARQVLGRILPMQEVETEFESIIASLRVEEGRMRELFLPGGRRITYMTMVLALFQAITGINIVMYYAPRIFLNAGIKTGDAYGHSIIIGLVMIFFTIVAMLIVDRVGRRPIMIAASAGMGISLFLMGLAFPTAETNGLMLLIYTLSFVSWFSVGMGGIYWVVVSEIFPNRVRGRAMALSVVFLWGGNFLVAQFFPYMLSALQGHVFNVFAFCCLLCFVFIIAFVPETKGRTLEAIERDYYLHNGGKSATHSGT